MTPDSSPERSSLPTAGLKDIARKFVAARRHPEPLAGFPGTLPDTLDTAYQCQELAIDLWGEPIGGWKVGRIPMKLENRFSCDRLAGPIFRDTVIAQANGEVRDMPIYIGGFAAVEAEFVAVIDADAPADKLRWSLDEATDMIGDLCIGLEIASSPLATINELGPTAVVADFGNNAGLIVGPSIENWRQRELDTLTCETFVDERSVGTGGAFLLTGGFARSVQFMLELAAQRGRPLKAGMVVATGQTTGIHDVSEGQQSRIRFGGDGTLSCRLVAAR